MRLEGQAEVKASEKMTVLKDKPSNDFNLLQGWLLALWRAGSKTLERHHKRQRHPSPISKTQSENRKDRLFDVTYLPTNLIKSETHILRCSYTPCTTQTNSAPATLAPSGDHPGFMICLHAQGRYCGVTSAIRALSKEPNTSSSSNKETTVTRFMGPLLSPWQAN